MRTIDVNCDLGESYGAFVVGEDAAVIPLITSANVACGWHGGDPVVMENTLRACARAGVAVGAHPGYPDLMGFGRRAMQLTAQEQRTYLQYQIGALGGMCRAQGLALRHVKPHGALYNMAAVDSALAKTLCEAIAALDEGLVLLALSGSEMVHAARAAGLPVAREVFADRAYRRDGTLVPRGQPGAMIEDEAQAIARVLQMVGQGTVQAIDGSTIAMAADSICIHGDGPHALAFARRIRAALEAAGVGLGPPCGA